MTNPCLSCHHLLDRERKQCTAYDEIPHQIWNGMNPHTEHVFGDHGILYRRMDEK